MENHLPSRNSPVASGAASIRPAARSHTPSSNTPISNTRASPQDQTPTVHGIGDGVMTSELEAERPHMNSGNVQILPGLKRARKERGPNWSPLEILVLIEAKRLMHMRGKEITDNRDSMIPDASKWHRISLHVNNAGLSPCHRDGAACKSKWNLLIPDYKRIADFLNRTGTNEPSYWNLSADQKKADGLPRSFPEEVFFQIHEWYSSMATIMPPHARDVLSGDGSNYKSPMTTISDRDHAEISDDPDEDPMDLANDDSEDTSPSSQSGAGGPRRPAGEGSERTGHRSPIQLTQASPAASPSIPCRRSIPPGITPHLISSSDTADEPRRHTAGSTGVRRRSASGHSLIAEATRLTGDAMSVQMREMVNASRRLEQTKIDVHEKCFTQQMEYQQERDRRLHEAARQANANAELSIQKQGEVVMCLAQLCTILSSGLLGKKADCSHSGKTSDLSGDA